MIFMHLGIQIHRAPTDLKKKMIQRFGTREPTRELVRVAQLINWGEKIHISVSKRLNST